MSSKGFNRSDRIAKLIHRELAKIIQQYPKVPDFWQVTITYVKVSRDLSFAKVFIAFLEDKDREVIFKLLNREKSGFVKLLAKRVSLRVIPKLIFVYDDSIAESIKLESLFKKISEEEQKKKSKSKKDV